MKEWGFKMNLRQKKSFTTQWINRIKRYTGLLKEQAAATRDNLKRLRKNRNASINLRGHSTRTDLNWLENTLKEQEKELEVLEDFRKLIDHPETPGLLKVFGRKV